MAGWWGKQLLQIGPGPAVQGRGDHVPALLKHGDQCSRLVHSWPLSVLVLVPVTVGISFPHPEVEPVEARTDQMVEQCANRALLGSRREGQLCRGKWCDGVDQGLLIVLPPWFVQRRQGRYRFCHSGLLLAADIMLPPMGTSVSVAWSRDQNFFYRAIFWHG